MQTLALIVAIVLGARASARAEKVIPFISGGLSIGAALHPDRDNGFLVGGELSAGGLLAYQKDNPGAETTSTGPPVWFGVYIDVLRDYGSNTTRVSFGPEVGWRVIGLDGGIVRELGDDAAWGCAIRPSFTVGPLSAYVRYTRFSSDAPESSHVEVGLLVKLPYAPGLKLF